MTSNVIRRLMALLISLTMLMGCCAVSHAEDGAALSLYFAGLTANGTGSWKSVALDGSFAVFQNDAYVGDVTITGGRSTVLALSSSGAVLLKPIMSTMPEGYLIPEQGCAATVKAGSETTVPVQVYADAGLFRITARQGGTFRLYDEDGRPVMTFSKEEGTEYVLQDALPSGYYYLEKNEAEGEIIFRIQAYKGLRDQVTVLDDAALSTFGGDEGQWDEPETDLGEETSPAEEQPEEIPEEVHEEIPEEEQPEEVLPVEKEPQPESETLPQDEDTETELTDLIPVQDEEIVIAGSGILTGRVDGRTHVSLYDQQLNLLSETDALDSYTFDLLPDGLYVIRTSAGGCAVIDLKNGARYALDALTPAATTVRLNTFLDANNNGSKGNYEKTADFVTVEAVLLYGQEEIVVDSRKADGNGVILFENLPEGTYRFRAHVPAGYSFGKLGKDTKSGYSIFDASIETTQDSAQTYQVTEGVMLDMGVGIMEMCSVTGICWYDTNMDGIMQADEPGMPGVLMTLTGKLNGLVYTAVSGEDGSYVIGQVKLGNYELSATLPEGVMFTRYSSTGGKMRSIFTAEGKTSQKKSFELKYGETFGEQHVGVVEDAGVRVFCFLDANYNGYWDEGELPLPGVEMEIYRQNFDKGLDEGLSGADGVYTFSGLRGGTYKIRALLPKGAAYTVTTDDFGGNQFKARPNRRENWVNNIEVNASSSLEMVIGAIYPGTVSGTVYMDDDCSGTMNGNERVVASIDLKLFDETGAQIAVIRTNNKGVYTFENLVPGEYHIEMDAKAGYAFTRPGENNVMLNTENGHGRTEAFRVELGENVTGMDAGMIKPGTITGTVFEDKNDNGSRDAGENGLVGAVVTLLENDEAVYSAVIGREGTFTFDAVIPGSYVLRYDMPEDGVIAREAKGGNTIGGESATGTSGTVTVKAGAVTTAPLCGGLVLAKVSGTAFADHNGDGRFDSDEDAFDCLRVALSYADGTAAYETVTDADGAFEIRDIRPGEYILTAEMPAGYVVSRTDALTLPVTTAAAEINSKLNVQAGSRWVDQAIGYVIPSSMMGQLWLDEDLNGQPDDGERTPAEETVTVIDGDTGKVYAVLTTDENGMFSLDGLIPGNYVLNFTPDKYTHLTKAGATTFAEGAKGVLTQTLEVAEGTDNSDILLGIIRSAELGGTVWVDLGGTINPLSGAEVTLYSEKGTFLQKAVTGADGAYSFDEIYPGSYTVSVLLPEKHLAVEADDDRLQRGHISVTSRTNGREAVSDFITVTMGDSQNGLDIGSVLAGRLGDYCWLDVNGNGMQDTDESGIPGLKVILMRNGEKVAETVTDQYGFYRFSELYPTGYTLSVNCPAEVKPTRQLAGPAIISSVMGEDGISAVVYVRSNADNYDADLGFVPLKKGVYPAGYGEGDTQNWTKPKH